MVKQLATTLRQAAADKRMDIEVEELKGETDPFITV
jgi:hypothetical protein